MCHKIIEDLTATRVLHNEVERFFGLYHFEQLDCLLTERKEIDDETAGRGEFEFGMLPMFGWSKPFIIFTSRYSWFYKINNRTFCRVRKLKKKLKTDFLQTSLIQLGLVDDFDSDLIIDGKHFIR